LKTRKEYDMKKTLVQFIAVSAAYLIGGAAIAQTTTPSGGTTTTASTSATVAATTLDASAATSSTSGSPQVARLAGSFSSFAGSDANAEALVIGLRNGTPITLSETTIATSGTATTGTTATAVTTSTTFTPPTGRMGWGNVRHALTMAKLELAAQGITDPSTAQIQAALTGGSISTVNASGVQTATQLPGILTLRSQHIGWGRIAQTIGVKQGAFANAAGSSVSGGTITTASGTTASRHGGSARTTRGADDGSARAETASRGRVLTAGAGAGLSNRSAVAAVHANGQAVSAAGTAFGHAGGATPVSSRGRH
jgi:hypothetical protein